MVMQKRKKEKTRFLFENKKEKVSYLVENKKAQVKILVVILIILISIVAFVIVWNLVNSLIREKSDEVGLGRFGISLEIEEVGVFETGALKIIIRRGSGGEFDNLKFIFYDEDGNAVTRDGDWLDELETKTYSFSPISEIGKINEVGVVPVVGRTIGIESKKLAEEILQVPSGVVSWWKFEDANDFMGKNNCELLEGDVDGELTGILNCGNDLSLDIYNEMAISFWIKTSENEGVISKGENYKVIIEEGFVSFSVAGEKIISDDRIELMDDAWHHIVIGSTGIYIDGEANNVIGINGGVIIEDEDFFIGRINGELDELMFFNKTLGISQVLGLFNNQRERFGV